MKYNILLFAKEKPGLDEVLAFLKNSNHNIEYYIGSIGDDYPRINYQYDILLSYMSPWIVKKETLDMIKKWAINFHPGPPNYPGIGCTNFALYNKEIEFGVTAHIMEEKVDSGKILNVRRFPILKNDSVFDLTQRCYFYIYTQFIDLMQFIFNKNEIPECNEIWLRKPFTRKQLNELCVIEHNMSEDEVERRIRATTFQGMPGAYIKIYNRKFIFES